ncbi:hypothetical protein PCASD_09148 [Puccinia coronata f. sp. avenae]|uniref:Uncharacterized protein n=1 Tax=Puccinia coronata f. sp. avenae TaxID=200324 RepID=A0A2N5V4J3_9BASI|nr:hypothetical protein PCASD_09148 [Puccinia coronata f. sp. avenae]
MYLFGIGAGTEHHTASLTFFTTNHHCQHPPPIMPHQFSAQAQVIRDLFINLVLLNHEEGNDLVDSALGIRTVPTIGQILHPNNSTQALIFNLIIGEEAQIEDCLAWVLSQRYLDTRSPGRFRDKYDLALLFDARDADFKQAQPPSTPNRTSISPYSGKAWFKRKRRIGGTIFTKPGCWTWNGGESNSAGPLRNQQSISGVCRVAQ